MERATVKNIQIIDGAENCVYEVFAASEEEFELVFSGSQDVAFIGEVYSNGDRELLDAAFDRIWTRRIRKSEAKGIHGTLFYGLEEKKVFYPTRRDEDAVNPDGSRLRSARACSSPDATPQVEP